MSNHKLQYVDYPNYHRPEAFYIVKCGEKTFEVIQKPKYCQGCGDVI